MGRNLRPYEGLSKQDSSSSWMAYREQNGSKRGPKLLGEPMKRGRDNTPTLSWQACQRRETSIPTFSEVPRICMRQCQVVLARMSFQLPTSESYFDMPRVVAGKRRSDHEKGD